MAAIPIQDLNTTVSPPADRSIRAVVTLLWPYSSSTRQCALLLSDPDFRLRTRKGQVRVQFSGAAGRAVAERRLGIGDAVVLELEGAEWVGIGGGSGSGSVQTPGKSVGELRFAGGLGLRVLKEDGEEVQVRVEADEIDREGVDGERVGGVGATPANRPSAVDGFRSGFGSAPSGSAAVYSSPAFLRRPRLSAFESVDSTYEGLVRLFGDDLEEQQSPRKRARVSTGEVRDWRMVSRTPSPVRPTFGLAAKNQAPPAGQQGASSVDEDGMKVDGEASGVELSSPTPAAARLASQLPEAVPLQTLGEHQETTTKSISEPTAIASPPAASALHQLATSALDAAQHVLPEAMPQPMLPPPLPRLQVPSSPPEPPEGEAESTTGPSSPHLQPISSASLPLPSPFPAETTSSQHLSPSVRTREVQDSYAEDTDSLAETQRMPQSRRRRQISATYAEDEDKPVSSSPQRAPQTASVEDEQTLRAPAFAPIDSTQALLKSAASGLEDPAEPTQASEAVVEDLASSSDEDEVMHENEDDEDYEDLEEDDVDEVYEADELEGEEPSNDDSGDEYEDDYDMQEPAAQAAELPQEVESVSESESEDEEPPIFAGETAPQSQETPVKRSDPSAQTGLYYYATTAEVAAPREKPAAEPITQAKTSQPAPQAPSQPRKPATMETPAKPPPRIVSGFSHTAPTSKPAPDFGTDGAIPDPITPLVVSKEKDAKAPLSAHGRTMRKSLRSLFGFRGSPSPTKEDAPLVAGDADRSTEPGPRESDVGQGEPKDNVATDQQAIAEQERAHSVDPRSPGQKPESPQSSQKSSAKEQVASLGQPPSSTVPPSSSAVQVIDLGDSSDEEDDEADAPMADVDSSPAKPAAAVPEGKPTEPARPLDAANEQPAAEPELPDQLSPNPADLFILTGPEEERRQSEHAIIDESPILERPREKPSPLFSPNESDYQPAPLSASRSEDQVEGSRSLQQAEQSPEDRFEIIPVDDDHNVAVWPDTQRQPYEQAEHKEQDLLDADQPATEPGRDSFVTTSFQLLSSSPPPAPETASKAKDDREDVEMLDLSQAEPEPWYRASQGQSRCSLHQSQQSRKVMVEDSVDSPQTTLAAVSSRPASRDTVESFSQTMAFQPSQQAFDYLGFANSVTPSQELGSASGMLGALPRYATSRGSSAGSQRRQSACSTGVAQTPSPVSDQPDPQELEPLSPVRANERKDQALLDADKQEAQVGVKEVSSDETSIVSDESPSKSLPKIDQERPSYPTLPMSPSFSQSQPRAQSFPFEAQLPASEGGRAHLPLTPQLTQGQSDIEPKPTEENPSAQVSEPSRPKEPPSNAMPLEQIKPPKAPQRKSLKTRLSNVPDVISAWFSPKRSSMIARQVEDLEEADDSKKEEDVDTIRRQAKGYSTAHSYYTSLAALERHVNPSSQQVYGGPNTVDVLAVVTDHAKAPERAKGGPRDYFTIFHITDLTLPRQSHVRVEAFRPWKAVLPAADVGDVVLLRSFLVRSRKRQPYLLSTDSSAWCVWRFHEQKRVVDSEEADKPVWSRRRAGSDTREEVNGPAVEYGEAERIQVAKMREWWLAHSSELQAAGDDAAADRSAGEQDTGAKL